MTSTMFMQPGRLYSLVVAEWHSDAWMESEKQNPGDRCHKYEPKTIGASHMGASSPYVLIS